MSVALGLGPRLADPLAGADDAHPVTPNVRTAAVTRIVKGAPTRRPRVREANRRRERGITAMEVLLRARQSVRSIVFIPTLGRGIPTTNALTLRRVHNPR